MKRSPFFWFSLILSGLILGIILWRMGVQEESVFSPDLKNIKADLVLYGVKYKRDTKESPSKWLVNADIARFFEKKKEVDFENVNVTFFTKKGDTIWVTSKLGNYDISRGVLSVFGNVIVTGIGGYTLYTECLFYFPKKGTIEAPKNVKLIAEDGNQVKGHDMTYFIKEHRLLLYLPEVIITDDNDKKTETKRSKK